MTKVLIHPIPAGPKPGSGPNQLCQCATYLFRGGRSDVLIDPGSGAYEDQVLESIRRVGSDIEAVRYILLTHTHVDHALGAYRLRGPTRKLLASACAAEALANCDPEVWHEFPEYIIPTTVDQIVADGQRLDLCGVEVLCVYTPGHTDCSMSYAVDGPEGLTVFTGDLLGRGGHPAWAGSKAFSTDKTMASIEKLLALKPAKAYWGHGAVPGNATEWLANALALGRSGQWRFSGELHPDAKPPPGLRKRTELAGR